MEKIYVGIQMASRWTDPTALLVCALPPMVVANLVGLPYLALTGRLALAAALLAAQYVLWNYVYHKPEPGQPSKYLEFNDARLRAAYEGRKMPMSVLFESFIEGRVAFKGDALQVLAEHRNEFVNYRITFHTITWLLSQFLPGLSSSFKGRKATKKEIADHYDRGNDFFAAFLGPSMVYTSGVYRDLKRESLEQAQVNKMDLICDKLQLQRGERLLDIGCGWGTLARHAVSRYGARSVGVTLSVEGAAWCREKNREEGLKEGDCTILCQDYRDLRAARETFDKISSIEMAEHVGIRNFQLYLGTVRDLLRDDGIFLMQVAGLRQGSSWEDVAWGLFMSKYIFPGADASTPLNWYVRQMELAGFEVHSVETIGRHYSHTIRRWYQNWLDNAEAMRAKYGDRLYRLWEIFLSWSVVASGQGSAACYQIVAHKNLQTYPRDRWCDDKAVGVGARK